MDEGVLGKILLGIPALGSTTKRFEVIAYLLSTVRLTPTTLFQKMEKKGNNRSCY